MTAGVLSGSSILSPLRGQHLHPQENVASCQPLPQIAVLSGFEESHMATIYFSFLRKFCNSLLPRSKGRAGLAPKDSHRGELVSLQPSCFSAQHVSHHHHHKKAGFTGLCIGRGMCCTPLAVLLSRPSVSRCHPWGRSEFLLSQRFWGRAKPMGMGEASLGLSGKVSLPASPLCQTRAAVPPSVQACVSSGRNLDWWTGGKIQQRESRVRLAVAVSPYFRAMRCQKLQAHNTWAAKHGRGKTAVIVLCL